MHNFRNITTNNNLINVNETLSIDYKKTDTFALTFTLSIVLYELIVMITCLADVFKKNVNVVIKKTIFVKNCRNESKYYLKKKMNFRL